MRIEYRSFADDGEYYMSNKRREYR